ncbi:hypothetical protein J7T55_007365 [Diaporthe amygdali]|uniref:uncharacterized protein n=1 Tax=Phomopsis amygdali TaxID=1214568 RepID=UPI0022FDDD31|nr:uncharacterized protein J7T55_007365 [Diaporthe amygdali]KAJ0116385.1 hypothetical protein J7T55_007365 [Diaporthe amygdali]
MAKFLLHTFYATGHVLPMQAVAKALVDRGHEVVWLTSPEQESRVRASGARFVATAEIDRVDKVLQGADPRTLDEIVDVFFGGRLAAQVADLRAVLRGGFAPDVLLNDALPFGAAVLHELGEIPAYATLGVVPMYFREHAPKSTLGTLLSQPELIVGCLNTQRVDLGLAPIEPSQLLQYSPQLHIQASSPALEYDQTFHPTEYVGPLISPLNKTSSELPPWWNEVIASDRVVGITQGTFATDPTSLILPAIRALRDDPTLLLVVPSQQAAQIKEALLSDGGSIPATLRLAAWLPYEALLPRCRVLVTNGGYGSVTQALAHGVPLVCAGTSEDKKDTAARVTHLRAGVDLMTDCPGAEQVRGAVADILGDGSYRENAARVGRGLNSLGGATRVCELLEEVVGRT